MQTLGKYEIIKEIGRGGFATVYKVLQGPTPTGPTWCSAS